MNFKVPTIEELVASAHKDLLIKMEAVERLKSDPLNSYIIYSLELEIEETKDLISKRRGEIREEKLKKLGI